MEEPARTQPEFSPGERLARLEAEMASVAPLFDEKLDGLRRELVATSDAQKEAVDKAERSTSRQFATFVEQNDRKADVTQGRLFAVEKAVSDLATAIGSAKEARTEFRGSTLAWATVLATVLGGSVFALIVHALGG